MPRLSKFKRNQFGQLIEMPRTQKFFDSCKNQHVMMMNNGQYRLKKAIVTINKAKEYSKSRKATNDAALATTKTGMDSTDSEVGSDGDDSSLKDIPMDVIYEEKSINLIPFVSPGIVIRKVFVSLETSDLLFNFDVLSSIPGNMDKLESKPESAPESLRFVLYVLPPKYPYTIFQPKNAEEMKQLMNAAPSGSIPPRIQYELLENGSWKVVCLDVRAVKWFIKEVATWVYVPTDSITEYSLRVLPDHLMPKFVGLSCVVSQPISGDKFLRSVKVGKYFNGSKWEVSRIEECKIFFNVDPMSFQAICLSGFLINVKGENITVDIENNPFNAEHY